MSSTAERVFGWGYCCCCLPPTKESQLRRNYIISLFFLAIASGFIIMGVTLPAEVHRRATGALREAGELIDTGSKAFPTWQTNEDDPLTMSVYMWNVTNPHAVLEGERPVVEQCGPYVFDHVVVRFNASWTNDRTILAYKTQQYYRYRPELSNSSMFDDVIYSLNMPFQIAVGTFYPIPDNRGLLLLGFEKVSPFDRMWVRRPVNDLLFGYHTELGGQAVDYPGLLANHTSQDDGRIKTDVIWSGEGHPESIRQYIKWQDQEVVKICIFQSLFHSTCTPEELQPAYETITASSVGGSDGSFFVPPIERGARRPLWLPNLQRQLTVYNPTDVDDPSGPGVIRYRGVELYRFRIAEQDFLNSTLYPDNAQWYQNWYSGLFNCSSVAAGIELFQSRPHMLGVDPILQREIVGQRPVTDQHEFYVDVEPKTGATMNLQSRIQINIRLRTLPSIPITDNVTQTWFPNLRLNVLLPVIWFDDVHGISQTQADEFLEALETAEFVKSAARTVGLLFSFCFALAGLLIFIVAWRQGHKIRGGHYEASGLLHRPGGLKAPAYDFGSLHDGDEYNRDDAHERSRDGPYQHHHQRRRDSDGDDTDREREVGTGTVAGKKSVHKEPVNLGVAELADSEMDYDDDDNDDDDSSSVPSSQNSAASSLPRNDESYFTPHS